MATRTLDEHIEIARGVAGGKARIAGRRITVQDIVIWHEWVGRSTEEIAADHGLTLGDVHAALAYYYDHQEAVDKAIRDGEAFVKAMREQTPSKAARKLHGQED